MQTPPNSSNANTQQQHTQQQYTQANAYNANLMIGHELRSYFLQQGQSIGKLCGILYSNVIAYGFKSALSVLLQILCYVLFAFALYVVLTIPSDLPAFLAASSDQAALNELPLHTMEGINGFFLLLKILVFLMATPVLLCGMLLGRNRRKSKRLRTAYKEAELLKSNFDKAVVDFRF